MALLFKGLSDNVSNWKSELTTRIPDLDMRIWPDVGDINDIEIAFVWQPPPGDLKRYPNLKAIINLGAGVDPLLSDPELPRHLPISRIVDPNLTMQMTTYILFAVIRYHRRLDVYEERQKDAIWEYERALINDRCRVGIMGLGILGGHTARTLASLGFCVAGWSRHSKSIEGIETFAGNEGLIPFLNRTDILCCLLPLTSATEGIIDAKLLANLPRGARLINTSRGTLVVEEDLCVALDSGQISGATLDVFRTEPLPPDHRFWRDPKVLVTPHIASNTTPRSSAPMVAENILRALAGKPLLNQVDVEAGY